MILVEWSGCLYTLCKYISLFTYKIGTACRRLCVKDLYLTVLKYQFVFIFLIFSRSLNNILFLQKLVLIETKYTTIFVIIIIIIQ